MKNEKKTIDNPNMRLSPTTENPEMNRFIKTNKEIINIFEEMNKCTGLRSIQEFFELSIKPKMLDYGFSSELYKTTHYYTMTFKKKDLNEETTIKLKLNYEKSYGGSLFNLVLTSINYSKEINVHSITKDYIIEFDKEKTFIANNLSTKDDKDGFGYFEGKNEILNKYNDKTQNKISFDKGPMAIRKIDDCENIKIDYLINYKRKKISVDYIYLNDINDKTLSELFTINSFLKNNYEEFIKLFNGKPNSILEFCELNFIDSDVDVSNHFKNNNEKFINIFSKIKKIKNQKLKNTI